MDHFVVFPVNEDGIFLNPKLVGKALDDAMAPPFDFDDVFIYSHGWWTNGNDTIAEYGQYTIEFARTVLNLNKTIRNPPLHSFGMGIHWPSTLSEDGKTPAETLEPVSYYQMGSRANQVGANGLFATIRRALRIRQEKRGKPFRLTLIGHSFGCRVICKALQQLCQDMSNPNTPSGYKDFVNSTNIKVILLQAAFKNDEFEAGGNYDKVISLLNLKILVTTSQLDLELNKWFTEAETANNIAHFDLHQAVALGAGIGPLQNVPNAQAPGGGPSATTIQQYNAHNKGVPIQVSDGFGYSDISVLEAKERMLVADLTKLHAARVQNDYAWSSFSGSHSDVSNEEVYNLIAGFAFQ
ncbi:MAG: hypothetical protein ACXVBK_16235 [Flavisolibacter sp.]